MQTLVGVREAQDIILSRTVLGPVQVLPLKYVLGTVLAAPVRAQMDVPAFDNSAMDGFALDHRVTAAAHSKSPVRLPVVGFQAAGLIHFGSLKSGNALRIATGAYVPLDATAVVRQEDVWEEEGAVLITAPVQEGADVRHCGEETRRGDLILAAGTPVTAAVLGYLASIGVAELAVYTRPRVGIVATGTELVSLGGTPGAGQIFDSNSVALAAALQTDGISARVYPPLKDEADLQNAAIAKIMDENDFVIITGGVSVGQHDHVKEILVRLDVTPLFWKLRQKPGRPLFVGVRQEQMIFGLPGNPASSLISYYEYVRPALRHSMGYPEWALPERRLPCQATLTKEAGQTQFLRARISIENGMESVTPCQGQGSHSLKSFAEANALIMLPEEVTAVSVGEGVVVHVLP